MVSNESELKNDIREMTGYSTTVVSNDGLDTAYRRAKNHIRIEKGLDVSVEWFDSEFPQREDALFWYSCLFAKVQAGELDAQEVEVGAINPHTLLAKDDESVTQWYRSARNALDAIKPSQKFRSASPNRSERQYDEQTYDDQSGGSGSEVDSTDL